MEKIDKLLMEIAKETKKNKGSFFEINTKSNKIEGYLIRPPKIKLGGNKYAKLINGNY